MKTADRFVLAGLAGLAAYVWLRDRSWLLAPDDALPLLAAFPLFLWLGAPWHLSAGPLRFHRVGLTAGAALFLGGLVTDLGLLLALGWSLVLWAWLAPRLAPEARARVNRLLPLTVLAFPWLTLDFPGLGWWYRLSAAWTAENVFQVLGLAVHRDGTQLLIQRLPFDVSPACSGIKALQAMLVVGTAVCFLQAARYRGYWLCLAGLPAVAWLANVLRVLVIVASALSIGPEFASGWFHGTSGWVVIVGVFGALGFGLEALRPRLARTPTS